VKVVDLKYVQPGNALNFDGDNDYGIIPKNVSGDFTIEYWMKTTQSGTTGGLGTGIIDNEVSGVSGDIRNYLKGNKVYFDIGKGSDVEIGSNTTVNTGQWFHVAMTRNATTGLMRLYINGNLETNATGGTGALTAGSNLHFRKCKWFRR
jgi:hypothetical protein